MPGSIDAPGGDPYKSAALLAGLEFKELAPDLRYRWTQFWTDCFPA
ncbi:MAG: hypothetical protein QOI05_4434 [Bradyrhizobium sp.]|jgi:hypothetical protein|nr:hypothetical protein [Bradyrhizobium sp.]